MPNQGVEATIVLVTPVWCDARRLARFAPDLAAALAASQLPVKWLIADDGSGAEERQRLEKIRQEIAEVYSKVEVSGESHHRGKGATVRTAWTSQPQAEWLAFVDADGSVSARETVRLLREALRRRRSIIGVRVSSEETKVREGLWRAIRHRAFLGATRWLVGLETRDSQCGAKVIRGEEFRDVQGRLHEEGFAFDVELMVELHAAGHSWVELPVAWDEKDESRLRVGDSWKMLAALMEMRKRLLSES
ncbi:hypothetical protein HNR46_001240 [Haloferula luteola]|uniref:Glycosyltransferase 2-like domain-containing protein n=1 Tax=Haloferula luteola TaxID=595692 RepID=A0A840V1S4_9BACT|nr:glycosyltransferase [Haloferula luteola]MBB5351006.1 hypothetical protein [Haloferula luteola]